MKCMSQFNTFKFQLEVTDQIMLVLLKLKLNLIFEDLGRRFGISSSLSEFGNFVITFIAKYLIRGFLYYPTS